MRRARRTAGFLLSNPILVGTLTILVLGLAVYLSYISVNGLPFVRYYEINVQVANADELDKNSDVRIGGARVGQILSVTPEPPSRSWAHPYASLLLQLEPNLYPLSASTHYRIRLASVLGGKYLELVPGKRSARHVADGGTLRLSQKPGANHELPFTDLDTALGTFNPATQRAFRGATAGLTNAVAGRGAEINDILYSTLRLMRPLQGVLSVLADPATALERFLRATAGTTRVLASVAGPLTHLMSAGAITFGTLRRPSLGRLIDQLPPTESLATGVLRRATPELAQIARLTRALRPAAAILPKAAHRLDAIVTAARPVFKPIPKVAKALETALGAIEAVARDPASMKAFKFLGRNDLATFGASAFVGLGALLRATASAQLECNTTALWLRNFASGLSEGDQTAPWLRAMPVFQFQQSTQRASPAPDLHIDYYPQESLGSGCQAGNEPYRGAQRIGSPGRTSTVVDNTAPPAGVLARGRKAGLVP
jgi:ABC-type transporter Mla subunit MlaD